MKKLALAILFAAVIAGAFVLYLSQPQPASDAQLSRHEANAGNGGVLFTAGGCISCHKPAKDDSAADPNIPSGGEALNTPAGTFYPPNLTPDEATGLGRWTQAQFVGAMTRGVSPDGSHYLPAFPYTSYRHMTVEDLLDLFAYLKTLPPVKSVTPQADVPLLPLVRLATGVWKLLALSDKPGIAPDADLSAQWNRGAYLVKGPGHCGECHTPRNFLMMSRSDQFLAGGPHPESAKIKVPSLRGLIARKRFKDAKDLATALQWGEAFGYEDMSSGGMGSVQTNLSKLPAADREAIAEFLVSLE